jgi:hypothetical protein
VTTARGIRRMPKVHFLGDSITHGVGYPRGWATRLTAELHARTVRSGFREPFLAAGLSGVLIDGHPNAAGH